MQRRSVPRTDPRYNQVRSKNNDSVKKSREKSRRERDETIEAINQLEKDNEQLTQNIKMMKQEYERLQELFQQHTGISIDQLMSSETNSNSIPSIQTKESPSQPVLTINTNDEKTTTTSADIQLDPSTLDGAIVLINGVQYKIVSMHQT
jgi:predicted nuclease with TOPRIM domain